MHTRLLCINLCFLWLNLSVALKASDEQNAEAQFSQEMRDMFIQAMMYTKPDLDLCDTLKCVEGLLYWKEYKALKKAINAYQATKETREQFFTEDPYDNETFINALIDIKREPSPTKALHDKECLGEALVDITKQMLIRSEIDPNEIHILCDHEYFNQNKNHLAYASRPIIADVNGQLTHYRGSIAFKVQGNNAMQPHNMKLTAAHEVTHIKELHILKRDKFQKNIITKHDCTSTENHNDMQKKSASFATWVKSQEMQAELFPLIRFDDLDMLEQAIMKYIPQCIKWHREGTLNTRWHKSSPGATHPECSEILPYILKITQLRVHNQSPQYEKTQKNDHL